MHGQFSVAVDGAALFQVEAPTVFPDCSWSAPSWVTVKRLGSAPPVTVYQKQVMRVWRGTALAAVPVPGAVHSVLIQEAPQEYVYVRRQGLRFRTEAPIYTFVPDEALGTYAADVAGSYYVLDGMGNHRASLARVPLAWKQNPLAWYHDASALSLLGRQAHTRLVFDHPFRAYRANHQDTPLFWHTHISPRYPHHVKKKPGGRWTRVSHPDLREALRDFARKKRFHALETELLF